MAQIIVLISISYLCEKYSANEIFCISQGFDCLFDAYSSWSHYLTMGYLFNRDGLFTFSKPSWWRHQMETFSALLALCAGNSPITGEFPAQRPVTRSFDVFLDLRLKQQLSKQWRRRWFMTQSDSLWRHCNDTLLSEEGLCNTHTGIFIIKIIYTLNKMVNNLLDNYPNHRNIKLVGYYIFTILDRAFFKQKSQTRLV